MNNLDSSRPPVVRSLLENDLYKFPMWQVMLHRNPGAHAEYEFVCRSMPMFPLAELADEVNRELDHLCTLTFAPDEIEFLRGIRYLKSDFVDFLSIFRFQRRFITVATAGDRLTIRAAGPQVHVMAFEMFCLYIVSELYFRRLETPSLIEEGRRRLAAKIAMLGDFECERAHPFQMFDFGLRRRASAAWHDEVVATFAREVPQFFKGTSNVYLARQLGIAPIGTMAHEYLQSYQAYGGRLRDFQKTAFEDWVQEFRGELGIALTDVVGMDAFLGDFDLYFAKLFDGMRHDSGEPVEWGEKALAHYAKLRIDAHTKRLVFSDGLDLEKAFELYRKFGNRVGLGFGIGTNLTNDLGPAMKPLNIVMKVVSVNGHPVAKLSDSPGKTLCSDQTFLAYLRQVFNKPAEECAAC